MVTTVQSINTVAFPTRKSAKNINRGSSVRVEPHLELRLQLTNLLQTTLELPQLLQLFFEELEQNLSIDSLTYRNDKLTSNIELGNSARHNCHYKLITNQNALGEVTFSRCKRFSEKELQLLEMLIACLICPIRNALMYRDAIQSALRDPLTGSGNRMALENTLERDVALAKRHKHPLSVIVVDIDKFKLINDNFGHSAGDCVLKDVAQMLAKCSRDTDAAYHAYRFGGEEFVLILNNTEAQGSAIVAERVRRYIENMTTTYEDNSINVTVSVGVAALLEDDSMSSLFARADKALYEAKRKGRNQVVKAD
jgi:diguanylate cyclase (GGDEF)-like protein